MLIRSVQNMSRGESPVWHHQWVPLDRISHWLPQAVVASEDNLFLEHKGFDFVQIEKALEENKTRKKPEVPVLYHNKQLKTFFCGQAILSYEKGLKFILHFLSNIFGGKNELWKCISIQ